MEDDITGEPEINVDELRKSGVVKLKDKDMFFLWIKTTCSNLNSKWLRKLADNVKEELGEVYLSLDRCDVNRKR